MPPTLRDRRLLITSGPTRAGIDAVRFISNRSSGRLGAAIATEALALGATVTMVAGPESVLPQRETFTPEEWDRLRVVHVETVVDVLRSLEDELNALPPYDAVVHAMAVLDYVPRENAAEKTPSGAEEWPLTLVKTPKVIRYIRQWAPTAFLVSFKLEAGKPEERLQEMALASLRKYRADLVVANDVNRIRGELHPAMIINSTGRVLARPDTKSAIARDIGAILARAFSSQ